MESTPFSNQCDILADLWIQYKHEPDFEDFIEYNDLGLPLAYCIANGLVESTSEVERMVGETWNLLVTGLGTEDTGFESLSDLLELAPPE